VTDAVSVPDPARRAELLSTIMTAAPHARRAHRPHEHLLPLLVAAGAAVNPDGSAAVGRKVYEDCVLGTMSLSAYLFQ
jgi:aromatic ring-opening dioxygenase catalytic subunit (LigB family)